MESKEWTRPFEETVPLNLDGIHSCRNQCFKNNFTFFGLECPKQHRIKCHCGSVVDFTFQENSDNCEINKEEWINEDDEEISVLGPNETQERCEGPFIISGPKGETYYLGSHLRFSVYETRLRNFSMFKEFQCKSRVGIGGVVVFQ